MLIVLISAIGFCIPAWAANLDLRSETLLRGFERDTTRGEDQFVLPLYEYLSLNYQDPETGGFSAHLYGWGRKDLAESDYFEDDPDLELLYGYLQYAEPYGDFSARLGRQHVFAGITNQTVDGLHLSTGVGGHLTISAFGGLPSAYSQDNGIDGDAIVGGRLALHNQSAYQVGLAYHKVVDHNELIAETAGVDLTVDLSDQLSLSGLSAYNLDNHGWREHRYSAEWRWRELVISPRFHQFDFRDYFGDGTQAGSPFRFLGETDESLSLLGGDAELAVGRQVMVGVRANHYTYHGRDETALYTAGLLTVGRYSDVELGLEVGQMQGETEDNRYLRYRGYFFWQVAQWRLSEGFISGEAQLVDYAQAIYGETLSQYYALGLGRRVWSDLLMLKISATYAQDPYFDQDMGVLLSLIFEY